MTINQAADFVTNALKQPSNHELKERVKDSIRNKAATYMYQKSKAGESMQNFLLPFTVNLVKFNELEECEAPEDCSWLRTESDVPVTIALAIGAPFHSVGTVKGIPLTYTTRSNYMHARFMRTSEGQLFYMYENKRIIIPGKVKLDRLRVEAVLTDPSTISTVCAGTCFSDNDTYPIPGEIWDWVLNEIIKEQLNYTRGIIPDIEKKLNDEK